MCGPLMKQGHEEITLLFPTHKGFLCCWYLHLIPKTNKKVIYIPLVQDDWQYCSVTKESPREAVLLPLAIRIFTFLNNSV